MARHPGTTTPGTTTRGTATTGHTVRTGGKCIGGPLLALATVLFLAGCATSPAFDTEGVATSLTPQEAVSRYPASEGERILWGGVIVASENLASRSLLEVLSYPLDSSERPETDGSPRGRFLVIEEGYLETADYAPGRLLTLTGRVTDVDERQVGQAPYRYPVVEADRLYLWPRETRPGRSNVHFGIGVILTN